jgi:hypothetical protein
MFNVSGTAVTSRRVTIALAASATVGAFVIAATPVGATTPPQWPTAGRLPIGCDPAVVYANITSSSWTYEFTDSAVPTITSARVSTGAGNVGVLAPGGTNVYAYATATEPCSGVGTIAVNYARNGAINNGPFLANTTTDAFAGSWSGFIAKMQPDLAGVYTVPIARVQRRYDAFTLDQGFRLTNSTPGSGPVLVVGPWAVSRSYLLRQTTVTVAAPTSIKRGRLATVTGVLKYATNAGYVADAGEKVMVQTRVGTGAWKTVATVAANSAGAYSAKVALAKTSQVRVVHAAVLSGRFTAPVTSAVKTVKVA